MSEITEAADQVTCTERIIEITPDAVIVSNLGVASYVLAGVEDRPRNFYLWGSMGVTTPVGFGLAIGTDDPVTVLEGDGSLLMSLGVLSTIGAYNPPNLTVVVWDNAKYTTTGGQGTHSKNTDFETVARACGVSATHVTSDDTFDAAYRAAVATDRSEVIICDVDPLDPDARPPLDFAHIKRRVRDELA